MEAEYGRFFLSNYACRQAIGDDDGADSASDPAGATAGPVEISGAAGGALATTSVAHTEGAEPDGVEHAKPSSQAGAETLDTAAPGEEPGASAPAEAAKSTRASPVFVMATPSRQLSNTSTDTPSGIFGTAGLRDGVFTTDATPDTHRGSTDSVGSSGRCSSHDTAAEDFYSQGIDEGDSCLRAAKLKHSSILLLPGIMAATRQFFQVQVPTPYPGVQYRKSKNLEDKILRYAENGCTVSGQVEDNGEWLRTMGGFYLPVWVGPLQVLKPLAVDVKSAPPAKADSAWGFRWCFLCRSDQQTSKAEVVVP